MTAGEIKAILEKLLHEPVCAECGNELAADTDEETFLTVHPCNRCMDDAHGRGYYRGLHDAKTGRDRMPI